MKTKTLQIFINVGLFVSVCTCSLNAQPQAGSSVFSPKAGSSNVWLPTSKQPNGNEKTNKLPNDSTIQPFKSGIYKSGTYLPTGRTPGTQSPNGYKSGQQTKPSITNSRNSSPNNINQPEISGLSETVDTSGFSKIPSFKTIAAPVYQSYSETVDTSGFSKIPTLKSIQASNTPILHETTDNSGTGGNSPINQIFAKSRKGALEETVDTSFLAMKKNSVVRLVETVDTSHPVKKGIRSASVYLKGTGVKPVSGIVETVDMEELKKAAELVPTTPMDEANIPEYITAKTAARGQGVIGAYGAKPGQAVMFAPISLDTLIKNPRYKGGIANVLPSKRESPIGVLAPLPSKEEIVEEKLKKTQSIGKLDDLPPKEEIVKETNQSLGKLSDVPVDKPVVKADEKPVFIGKLAELPADFSSKKQVETQKNSINSFYKFDDGVINYDTTKVLTDLRGKTFTSNVFLPKQGKSIVLQPAIDNSSMLSGTTPVAFDFTNNNIKETPPSQVNTSEEKKNVEEVDLKPNFFIDQTGHFSVSFSTPLFYINLTQTGQVYDYAVNPNKNGLVQSDAASIKVGHNLSGLVDNINGVPIEYNSNLTVHKIGKWNIGYGGADNWINKVGSMNVKYNSNGSLNKVDNYKVVYDYKQKVMKIDDSKGLMIYRPK